MKKLLPILVVIFGIQTTHAQFVHTVWQADFENGGAPAPCSDTSSYRHNPTPPTTPLHGVDWAINSRLHYNGAYCDSATVAAGDTLWFNTCAFSTLGDNFVTVEFQHICKIDFLGDKAIVQVSNNNGATWNTLGANEYINTKGALAPIWAFGYGVFNEQSYGFIQTSPGKFRWLPSLDSLPTNSWWEYEYFNASAFLANSANCKLRFALCDGGTAGPVGKAGWYIDSVKVKAAPCESFRPLGMTMPPLINNNSTLYTLGPFQIYAKMWDEDAGFCDAWLSYSVNGGPADSVMMDSITAVGAPYNTVLDSVYLGVIPKTYNGGLDTIKAGDTICYWINVYDCSAPCRNQYRIPNDPSLTCIKFVIDKGQTLPFCDDFDTPANFFKWDTTMAVGSVGWERGNPLAGGGYAAHSGTNTWTTKLSGNYANLDRYYVNSPQFDFSTAVTPRITFWHRRDLPTLAADGDRFRLEVSVNNNTFNQLGGKNDLNAIPLNAPFCPSTWFNENNGWTGGWIYNGQWREAFYQLPPVFTGLGQVQFRFAFQADNNSLLGYGVSVDDWCLQNPPAIDMSAIEFIRPLDYIKKAGEKDSVCYRVRNLGTSTLASIPFNFEVHPLDPNIVQPVQFYTQTVTYPHGIYSAAGLPPLQYDTICFDTSNYYTVPQGQYYIKAYPSINADADSTNDTIKTVGHFGFISDTITHFTDFDNVPVRWATTIPQPGTCGNPAPATPTRWQLGAPNWGATNSTYSVPNSWDINLNSAYDNSATEYLYSQFYDMTNADSAFLSFWHNWNTVFAEDGYYLEYSFDRFKTAGIRLTAVSQPVGKKINWSNSYAPVGTFGAGWSGLSNGWQYSQVPLNNANFTGKQEVQFRFVFRSNNTVVIDGVSIDDFRIVNPEIYDAELFDIVLPERGCVKDVAEPVDIVVKNVGKDSIGEIPVFYRYRFDATCTGTYGPWSAVVADTIHSYIQPGLDLTFRFQDSVNMSIFGCYEFCAWTAHNLDNIQENDTLCGHVAENVFGCNIDMRLNTGTLTPDGEVLIQRQGTLDTLWIYPFSAIGANQIGWQQDICLYDVGNYIFSITSTNAAMVPYWRLRDPFADTTVAQGLAPGVTNFFWKCPPLLSAATERIRPYGPSRLPIPQTYQIDVQTRNKGSVKLVYVWMTTEIKKLVPAGGTVLTFTDSIFFKLTGDTILFPRLTTIDTVWQAEPGTYEICSWTFLPNGNPDSATFDDTACLVYTILDTIHTLPYCNDFNSNTTNPWAGLSDNKYDTLSSFKRGVPAQTHISAAASPPNAWMTYLNKNYPLLDSSSVYSPEFTIDTGSCYRVSFKHNFKTEHAFDGGVVEYTLDSGQTWRVLGGAFNARDTAYPMSTKGWYNTAFVTGLGGAPIVPGWTSTASTGWRESYRDVEFPNIGQNPIKVVLRFRFGADASIQNEGWAIDDFCLTANGNCIYYSCTDGIQNGKETGIDCGGPDCIPCPSCTDGFWNQNETSTDCGGVCPPCPSCVDNVKNGDEENIDCGGSKCPACATCTDGIQNWHWVGNPGTSKIWEDGVDCGGPCEKPCWLGVDEIDPNKLFLGQAIPNPAKDVTKIGYQIPDVGMVTLVIHNTLGTEMYRSQGEKDRGIYFEEISVSGWADGLYYYSILFNGETRVDKFVVNN